MYRSLLVISVLLVGQAILPARADTPAAAQAEIDFLLDFVATSGCQFYRNGTWYSPEEAQAHLRSKYNKAVSRWPIATAEDFIAKVATKSSVTGRPYEAKCRNGETISSSQWLNDALTRHRADAHPM